MNPTVSPSRLKKFRTECMRIEAFHLQGIKQEDDPDPNSPRNFGTRLHAVSEDYLNAGKRPDPRDEAGLRFIPGLRFLPPPGSGGVEADYRAKISKIRYQTVIDYHGRARDLPNPLESTILAKAHKLNCAAVVDHKSTKNPKKKWRDRATGKDTPTGLSTHEDFAKDEQALLYAAIALVLHPKDDYVLLAWIYYATEGAPHAEPRYALLSRKEVLTQFAAVVHRWSVPLIQLRRAKPDPLTVPPNTSNCWKYKSTSKDPKKREAAPGCWLQDRCTDVSDMDKTFGRLEPMDEDDLLEKLTKSMAKTDKKGGGPDRINGRRKDGRAAPREPEPEIEREDEDEEEERPRKAAKRREVEADEDERPRKKSKQAELDFEDEDEEEERPRKAKKSSKRAPEVADEDMEEDEDDRPAKKKPAPAKATVVQVNKGDRTLLAASALETAARQLKGKNASPDDIAELAVELADALIKALAS
jgi:hypothetical protein